MNTRLGEQGASAVEFALVFPLLAMMLFGMISAGLALNQQQQINHAAREASRFAATYPDFPDEEASFQAVASRAATTAVEQLNRDDAYVCVAHFLDSSATYRWYAGSDTSTAVSSAVTHPDAGNPGPDCSDPLTGAEGERIHVVVTLPSRIEAVLVRNDSLVLSASAVSVYEAIP